MRCIKDLYSKNPVLVRAWIRKMFDIGNQQRLFDIRSLSDYINEDCVLLGMIDLETRDIAEILLEDFSVCYGNKHLKIDDKRMQYYLIQMARNCDDKYIQGFHDFRIKSRIGDAADYNAKTYKMEALMAKSINQIRAKEDKSL